MIDQQTITRLSHKFQTVEQNIVKEYCQHLLLFYLYRQTEAEKLLFKGGTALKIVFNSPRFSEGLDFSSANLKVYGINQIVDQAISDINKEGIIAEKKVDPETQGATSGGYYAIINLHLNDSQTQISVQVSTRQQKSIVGDTTLIQNEFLPAYTLIHLVEKDIVKEKIQALLARAKPRDFFDLYFILRHPGLVKHIPKGVKKELLEAMTRLKNGWQDELKLFLPVSHHGLIKDFKDRLKKRNCDSCILDAYPHYLL